jgi:hypothetical protein
MPKKRKSRRKILRICVQTLPQSLAKFTAMSCTFTGKLKDPGRRDQVVR